MASAGNAVRRRWLATFLLIGAIALSCQEVLPPRNDPGHLFDGRLRATYQLSRFENTIRVTLTLVNIYDETLQGAARFDGWLRFQLNRDTTYSRTFRLSDTLLLFARSYNSRTRELTIDHGDSLQLQAEWDYLDDRGRDFRHEVFGYYADTSCSGRRIAHREDFSMSGYVKVFERAAGEEYPSAPYAFCHVNMYVDPHTCRSIRTDVPCDQW